MTPFTTMTSRICPIDAADVDTDQILPKQFLKRTERSGFGEFAFFDWRYDADGQPRPDFTMNRPEHRGAAILLAGRNFGCGSSREHAPWALEDAGFAVIVAPSFGDIFRNNCANIGLLAISLDDALVRELFDRVAEDPSFFLTVDLEACSISGEGFNTEFAVDAHTRRRLLDGADAIALTLRHAGAIDAFEETRPAWRPAVTRSRVTGGAARDVALGMRGRCPHAEVGERIHQARADRCRCPAPSLRSSVAHPREFRASC